MKGLGKIFSQERDLYLLLYYNNAGKNSGFAEN